MYMTTWQVGRESEATTWPFLTSLSTSTDVVAVCSTFHRQCMLKHADLRQSHFDTINQRFCEIHISWAWCVLFVSLSLSGKPPNLPKINKFRTVSPTFPYFCVGDIPIQSHINQHLDTILEIALSSVIASPQKGHCSFHGSLSQRLKLQTFVGIFCREKLKSF